MPIYRPWFGYFAQPSTWSCHPQSLSRPMSSHINFQSIHLQKQISTCPFWGQTFWTDHWSWSPRDLELSGSVTWTVTWLMRRCATAEPPPGCDEVICDRLIPSHCFSYTWGHYIGRINQIDSKLYLLVTLLPVDYSRRIIGKPYVGTKLGISFCNPVCLSFNIFRQMYLANNKMSKTKYGLIPLNI